jgi:hypothetical protein
LQLYHDLFVTYRAVTTEAAINEIFYRTIQFLKPLEQIFPGYKNFSLHHWIILTLSMTKAALPSSLIGMSGRKTLQKRLFTETVQLSDQEIGKRWPELDQLPTPTEGDHGSQLVCMAREVSK